MAAMSDAATEQPDRPTGLAERERVLATLRAPARPLRRRGTRPWCPYGPLATMGFARILIGEACAGLPKDRDGRAADLAARHPESDRRGFVKLRHIVAHQHFRVQPDLVGGVVQDELPALARAVRAELARA